MLEDAKWRSLLQIKTKCGCKCMLHGWMQTRYVNVQDKTYNSQNTYIKLVAYKSKHIHGHKNKYKILSRYFMKHTCRSVSIFRELKKRTQSKHAYDKSRT